MATKFWANPTLEPKSAHRWLLNLNAGTGLDDYIIKRVDKPSFTVGQSEHMFFGHSFYYPGTVKWQPISLTIVDPVQPDASMALYQALKNSGYRPPTEMDGLPNEAHGLHTVSKAESTSVFSDKIFLKQFAPINGVDQLIEVWELSNPWLKDVKFGGLDYGSDAIVEVTLTIVYDFAKLEKPAGI